MASIQLLGVAICPEISEQDGVRPILPVYSTFTDRHSCGMASNPSHIAEEPVAGLTSNLSVVSYTLSLLSSTLFAFLASRPASLHGK